MIRFTTRYGLTEDRDGGLGLSCTAAGLSLAGVPLLRKGGAGFAPRTPDEVETLLQAAYGDTARLSSSALDSIADALNRGDLAKAAMTAVFLKLPDLDADGAVRMILADDALAKYSPDQPRDDHGRWTGGDGNGIAAPKTRGSTDPLGPPSAPLRQTTVHQPTADPVDHAAPAAENLSDPSKDGDPANGDLTHNPLRQDVSWLPPASRSPYPTGPKGPSTAPKFAAPGPTIGEIMGSGSARDALGMVEDWASFYHDAKEVGMYNRVLEYTRINKDYRAMSQFLDGGIFQGIQFDDPQKTSFFVIPIYPNGHSIIETKIWSGGILWTDDNVHWRSMRSDPPPVRH